MEPLLEQVIAAILAHEKHTGAPIKDMPLLLQSVETVFHQYEGIFGDSPVHHHSHSDMNDSVTSSTGYGESSFQHSPHNQAVVSEPADRRP